VAFQLNGREVDVAADGSLLDALRDGLGVRSPKDGCAPQGQCGCCTVWVDGQPRVSCVTPVARVAGRNVTTVEGLGDGLGERWAEALCATGGSQCGFCTPGILMRLAALAAPVADGAARQSLLAHVCRCTGWQTILEAAALAGGGAHPDAAAGVRTAIEVTSAGERERSDTSRDLDAARQRAVLEGHVGQDVGPHVALGRGGFADDIAPAGALVAMRDPDGEWVVADSVAGARRAAGKVQGRKSTIGLRWPIDVPPGEWARTLQTTWVEPAYLEPDAAWCTPGGEPVGPLANGGAFGAKHPEVPDGGIDVAAMARRLADEHGRPVRVLLSREDAVRLTPKRPPLAAGVRADGTGIVRVARTPGIADAIASVAPGLVVEEVDLPGPPTSAMIRAAGWAEAAVLLAGLRADTGPDVEPDPGGDEPSWHPTDVVAAPNGARAGASIDADGTVRVRVRCGRVLDEVVLRSYCIGAAHMGLGWVRSEGIAVDAEGTVHDLTIRSFGVIRAVDTPRIEVEIEPDDGEPVNGSDAVFAAVAAAASRHAGFPPAWPIAR
jgi:aerobic-type carbon monoxide dehydrogenase small subunit (CoxS/CutS family)